MTVLSSLHLRFVVVVVVVTLVAAACSDSEISRAQVQNLEDRTELTGEIDMEELTADEQLCVLDAQSGIDITAAISDVGVDGDAARTALTRSVLTCVEDPVEFDSWVSTIARSIELRYGNGIVFSDTEATCLVGDVLANSADPAR